ncbi:MAG: integrase family protein [Anaeromyxobacter sp.]
MKRIELTTEWLGNWAPIKETEVSDRGCKGLVIRGGPAGGRTFYRWSDVRDTATGKVRRRRVKLGRWPALSLSEARKAVHDARETLKAERPGSPDLSVAQVAEAYRRDILAQREPASLAWSWGIIRTHVLAARPDPRGPEFREWPARTVRAPDIAAVIRAAKMERTVEVRTEDGGTVARKLGGAAAARAALREVKAMFAAAVGSGSLEMSPAAVLQASALGLKGTKRGRFLDSNELAALFEALDLNALLDGTAKDQKLSKTVRLGIAFLHYVPVRTHSLVAAEWREFDLEACRWTIPVARMKLHRDDRAEARPFVVPLPPTAIAILKRLQEQAGGSRWVLASPKDPKKHVGAKVLVRALARLQESGRLSFGSRLTIHDARRTWRRWAGNSAFPSRSPRRASPTRCLASPILTPRPNSSSSVRTRPTSWLPHSTGFGWARMLPWFPWPPVRARKDHGRRRGV